MHYCFQYVPKHVIFSILLILVGFKFWFKWFMIIGVVYFLFLLYFFRQPKEKALPDSNAVFAPCYGKVIKVQERDGLLQIATFINLWDPHIQYAPYKGHITGQIFKKGEFNPAYIFAKGKDNEKMIHNIQTDRGLMTVVQIAGVIARSIEAFVSKGDQVQQNSELGLIRFGSRCDIFIPIENKFNILVKEGDKIKGGITKLVQFF